jgi:hypothetical protein
MLDIEAFREINRIVEYDATSDTHKFALLKNVIDVCQKYDHLVDRGDGSVKIPLGLVVEGWMFDYLPIRQQNARGKF